MPSELAAVLFLALAWLLDSEQPGRARLPACVDGTSPVKAGGDGVELY